MDAASDERYQSLHEWEQLSERWKSEGDMYGWNFHKGMVAGANYVDIYYHRVRRAIDSVRAATTPSPDAAREAAKALYDDLRGRQGFDCDIDDETESEILSEWTEIIHKHCLPTGGENQSE